MTEYALSSLLASIEVISPTLPVKIVMIADTHDDINTASHLSPNEIPGLEHRVLETEQSKMKKRDENRKMATYREASEITALKEAHREDASIKVPFQRKYSGRKPIITSSLANTPCVDLEIDKILSHLNALLGTSYKLTGDSLLSSLLQSCISTKSDFGTAYSRLRPEWFSDLSTIEDTQRKLEAEDLETRERVLVDNRIRSAMPPRRVWDLYSNRVVLYCFILEEPWAVLHDWVDEKDRIPVSTPINRYEWPVSIPKDANLDLIRIELLNLGAEYVWLDALCLRQKGGKEDNLLEKEWSTDIPTIPNVRRWSEVVVHYSGGLGRVSGPTDLMRRHFNVCDRSWFRSAWVLPEVARQQFEIVAGDDTKQTENLEGNVPSSRKQLDAKQLGKESICGAHRLFDILSNMQARVAINPLDRIVGLTYLVQSYMIPTYHYSQSLEEAWTALVNVMNSLHRGQLLFLFPEPGNADTKWGLSWEQVMTRPLPTDVFCSSRVHYDDKTHMDWYEGPCIESGFVRGLAVEHAAGIDRAGELIVDDTYGAARTFKIIASHRHPIPEATYVLLGNEAMSPDGIIQSTHYWVVGRRLPDQRFEKVSVFEMTDSEEGKRLNDLRVTVQRRYTLA